MSYPYPQNRHRDRKEEGEQPYTDAKEQLAQSEAYLKEEEQSYAEAHKPEPESDEERIAELEADATEQLGATSEKLRRERIDELLRSSDSDKAG